VDDLEKMFEGLGMHEEAGTGPDVEVEFKYKERPGNIGVRRYSVTFGAQCKASMDSRDYYMHLCLR
jgi:hypothetical protein